MTKKAFTVALALSLSVPTIFAAPAIAQDVYDTQVLSKHADVERQRTLRRQTVGRNQPWGWNGNRRNTSTRTASSSNSQATCARHRAMVRQGASGAKVQQLSALCARAGY